MSATFIATSDAAVINGLIIAIKRSSVKMHELVSRCAASCVLHALEHGNVTPATRLIEAMSSAEGTSGWRNNALRQWFVDTGPFMWAESVDEEGKKRKGFKLNSDKRNTMVALYDTPASKLKLGSSMVVNNFYTMKPEPEFKPIDLIKSINALITAATKAKSKGDPRHNFTGLDELIALKASLASAEPASVTVN